jgi:hypothetical protein
MGENLEKAARQDLLRVGPVNVLASSRVGLMYLGVGRWEIGDLNTSSDAFNGQQKNERL